MDSFTIVTPPQISHSWEYYLTSPPAATLFLIWVYGLVIQKVVGILSGKHKILHKIVQPKYSKLDKNNCSKYDIESLTESTVELG